MKQTFREKRKEFKPIMRKMRGEIAKIGEVLVAEEFDTQAFDAATGDLKQINQAMFEQKLETMKALASQLPQEERQKLKGKFARVLMQKHPHKKRDHASQSKREGRGEERAYKKERAE
jgi:tRNA A37 methylthiotransferase MiaB